MSGFSAWVVATPRRLFLVVASAVVAPFVVVTGMTSGTAPVEPVTPLAAPSISAPAPSAAPASSAPVTPSPEVTGAPETDDHGAHDALARREVVDVADAYLTAFFTQRGSDRAWRAGIDALSTDTLARLNASVPRDVVDAARVRSLRLDAATASYSYGYVTARLADGTRLGLALVREPDGWKVTEVAPVQEVAP